MRITISVADGEILPRLRSLIGAVAEKEGIRIVVERADIHTGLGQASGNFQNSFIGSSNTLLTTQERERTAVERNPT